MLTPVACWVLTGGLSFSLPGPCYRAAWVFSCHGTWLLPEWWSACARVNKVESTMLYDLASEVIVITHPSTCCILLVKDQPWYNIGGTNKGINISAYHCQRLVFFCDHPKSLVMQLLRNTWNTMLSYFQEHNYLLFPLPSHPVTFYLSIHVVIFVRFRLNLCNKETSKYSSLDRNLFLSRREWVSAG